MVRLSPHQERFTPALLEQPGARPRRRGSQAFFIIAPFPLQIKETPPLSNYDVIDQEIIRRDYNTLSALVVHHQRTTHTPPARARAVQMLLRGIIEWITDNPTLGALIIEDIARMIERCNDVEEIRDLAVQIRNMMMEFEPDASRAALTEDEAQVLRQMDKL